MKVFYFIFILALTTACQINTESYINKLASENLSEDFNLFNNLSPEEKEAMIPNELFKAVYDKKEADHLREIIDDNAEYLLEINVEGDTPLGFAIKMSYLDQALFLLNQTDPGHYLHKNNLGESYLYLASQQGFVELMITLSNLFYERQKGFFIDYEFADLDFQNDKEERALHVAKNAAVAEVLSAEYRRGLFEYPLTKFQLLQNNEGQTFLHTAVSSQNEDLLRWGLQENCNQSEGFWIYAWEGIKAFFIGIHEGFDYYLLNTKDNEGLTALNLASKNSYFEAIRILSSCPWTDYLIKDNEGNTPLQNFLLSLNPLKDSHTDKVKNIFLRLSEKRSLLSFNSFSKNINSRNNKGENSLHIAAQLNDPFFYNKLKVHGNTEIKNNEGKRAREIFENHQKSIRLY